LKKVNLIEQCIRQIKTYTNSIRWINKDQGENENICLRFRKQLKGKADQVWRSIDRKEIINLNDWKNVKSQFQTQFATPKIAHATK
jgi:trans-2-enoyl-CoA reductase